MGAFPRNPIFSEYSKTFVETGTGGGRSARIAFSIGFQKVYSCDVRKLPRIDDLLSNPAFYFEQKKSTDFLREVLPTITTRATFFLDAHPPDFDPGEWSLWQELDLILNHSVKDHIIAIDDWDIIRQKHPQRIEKMIADKNSNYSFIALSFNNCADLLIAETCLNFSDNLLGKSLKGSR